MPEGTTPDVAVKQSKDVKNIVRLLELQANRDLWFKIHVLLYDLCNIARDRTAELRTLATTDELYISAPYFTPSEAILVKATLVLPPVLNEIPEFEALGAEEEEDDRASSNHPKKRSASRQHSVPQTPITIEEAIKSCLRSFFEKRRASGDARPCGPHDMGPIYLAVFGIAKEELKEEDFLSRLRRGGLPRLEAEIKAGERREQKAKNGRKKGPRKW